jgi:hypothetical protein
MAKSRSVANVHGSVPYRQLGAAVLLVLLSLSVTVMFQRFALRNDRQAATVKGPHLSNDTAIRPRIIRTTPVELLKNRTLVVLIGDLRCGEKAWESLYTNVLDHNQADLALFTQPPSQDEYKNSSLFERAMHVEMIPNYTDWSDALDLVAGPAWRRTVPRSHPSQSHSMVLGGVPGYTASGAVVNMFKWFVSQRIEENNWLSKYDRYVVTRTDQYYSCPLDVASLDPQYLWVPTGQDYRGVNDRLLIASKEFVVSALSTLVPFLKDPWRYAFMPANTNCERFLFYMWIDSGMAQILRRFPRSMFTCMAPTDTSSWGKISGYDEGAELHLKYPMEFNFTKKRCRLDSRRW